MESGAKAALSGFRKQALYILAAMIKGASGTKEFQPEGEEDLAIYEGGKLVRVVQVKALSTPLALSHLNSQKSQEDLFFLRVSNLPACQIEVTSFGELGPELEGLRVGNDAHKESIRKKVLDKTGLSEAKVDSLLDRFELNPVTEAELEKEIFDYLRVVPTAAGNPRHAFDLLTWWIYRASEDRRRITFVQFRDQIEGIGRYLAERKAKHDEWFTTIKPLEEIETLDGSQRGRLVQQYYRGESARFSHICADLDVRREGLLGEIDEQFQSNQVVILHGASGQGKTSLALRYLYDNVPAEWRFLIQAIDNRRHAASVANALADHLHAVEAPVYLLIDVAPTDLDWVALVRELLDKPNIRILVAIREEDLARNRASGAALGFPADIPLEFTEVEAESVYERLLERGDTPNAFPSFTDAWERFGGEGPLLEFVYLVTQKESLRARLESQVQRLRDEVDAELLPAEALRFLHICAIATAYESRIQLRPLAQHLKLQNPAGIVKKLEEEYLLREAPDKTTVEALHPFRSILLAELLDDPAFDPTAEVVLEALLFVPEVDLYVFLLYVFSRLPDSADLVVATLDQLEVSTWVGIAGVGKALLWKGMHDYRVQNRAIFDEAEEISGAAADILLAWDVAGVSDVNHSATMTELLRSANPDVFERIDALRDQLPSFEGIFSDLSDWLSKFQSRGTSIPESQAEWSGYAECLLWSGKTETDLSWYPDGNSIPVSDLPIDLIAELTSAVYETRPALYQAIMAVSGDFIREKFQRETQTLKLEDVGGELHCAFVVPMPSEEQQVQLSTQHERASDSGASTQEKDTVETLNDRAVYRATLLKMLFPGQERYCTQGYGHQITHAVGGFELPYDESFKTMAPDALHLPALVRTNATFRAMYEYRQRPKTWKEYAERILQAREAVASVLFKLNRNLERYFQRNRPHSIIAGQLSPEEWTLATDMSAILPRLPQSAVDEWGLASESIAKNQYLARRSISVASVFALNRHQRLRKTAGDYLTAANNFFNNAGVVCCCHGKWGREVHREEEVKAAFAPHGYDEHKIRLSKHNLFLAMQQLEAMQDEFADALGVLVDDDRIARLTQRELRLFPGLWALWYQFCHHPERKVHGAGLRAVSAMGRARDQLLANLRSAFSSGPSGWSARILSGQHTWEDGTALVVELAIDNILQIEEARSGVLQGIHEALGDLNIGSLEQYALEYFWKSVVIVPTWEGKATESGAWILPSTLADGAPDRVWLRPLQQAEEGQLHGLGFEIHQSREAGQMKEVQEQLSTAHAVYVYIANFSELLPDLGELGKEILVDSLNQPLRMLEECLTQLHDLLPDAVAHAHSLCEESEGLKETLVDPLDELFDWLTRVEGSNVNVKIWDAPEEAARFGGLSGNAALLRWMSIAGSAAALLETDFDADAELPSD